MSFSFDHVPEQQRCYQSIWGTHRNWPIADCFFGVPSSASYGRKRFTSVPFFCRGFHFYLGADQQDLFDSYIESDWPAWTRSLHIGNSSYDLGKGSDYSRLMASLARTDFPRLEKLELGVWQLFCNSHCLFGQLGNLDGLGSRMPRLTSLSLFGNFELQEPLSIPTLERLDVQTDDPITCLNGGPLDVETVQNIFRSSFENLREFCADLEVYESDVEYMLPQEFLDGKNLPNLKGLEVVGNFRSGEQSRLQNSVLLRDGYVKANIRDMIERQ